jgi:hypothetical protein
MSNDVDHERAWVAALYPGKGWKKKVGKMKPEQVLAIYIREHQKAKAPKQSKES